MSDQHLTLPELAHLATLYRWVKEGRKVTWAIEGDTNRLMSGVLRHFVRDGDSMGFLGGNDDVRESFVRISAGMEWVLPVRDVVGLMDDSLFVSEGGNA